MGRVIAVFLFVVQTLPFAPACTHLKQNFRIHLSHGSQHPHPHSHHPVRDPSGLWGPRVFPPEQCDSPSAPSSPLLSPAPLPYDPPRSPIRCNSCHHLLLEKTKVSSGLLRIAPPPPRFSSLTLQLGRAVWNLNPSSGFRRRPETRNPLLCLGKWHFFGVQSQRLDFLSFGGRGNGLPGPHSVSRLQPREYSVNERIHERMNELCLTAKFQVWKGSLGACQGRWRALKSPAGRANHWGVGVGIALRSV